MDAGKKMLSNGKIVIQSDLKKIIQDQKFLTKSEDWRVEAFRNIMTCLEDNAFPCFLAEMLVERDPSALPSLDKTLRWLER